MYKDFDRLPETKLLPNLKIGWKKIFVFTFIAVFVSFLINAFIKNRSLDKNFKITIGQINHINKSTGKNSSRELDYEYYVNGNRYLSNLGTSVCDNYTISELASLVINRKFYVVYDTTNFDNSNIILKLTQAEKYKINITDTILYFDSIFNCEKVYSNNY